MKDVQSRLCETNYVVIIWLYHMVLFVSVEFLQHKRRTRNSLYIALLRETWKQGHLFCRW